MKVFTAGEKRGKSEAILFFHNGCTPLRTGPCYYLNFIYLAIIYSPSAFTLEHIDVIVINPLHIYTVIPEASIFIRAGT
jgi:hypothetical protein